MSTVITISPGGQLEKDPYDDKVWVFNWDQHLTPGATISPAAVLADFTVICVSKGGEMPPDLTIADVTMVTGNRKVQFTVKGGTPGKTYNIALKVSTSETPAQKRERSFYAWVREM